MFDNKQQEPEDILSNIDKDTPKPAAPVTPPPQVTPEPVAQPEVAAPVVEPVVEPVIQPEVAAEPVPAQTPAEPAQPSLDPEPSSEISVVANGKLVKTSIMIVAAIAVVIIAILIGRALLTGDTEAIDLVMPEDMNIDIVPDDVDQIVEDEVDNDPVIATTPDPVGPVDTDRDGLSDLQEAELGTNIGVADTDADGLSDFEEVNTWETDPLDPDTDGDSFIDGAEVDSGYNPNGSGKLTDLPTEEDVE